MRYSPRNIRIACDHRGLTHFGGVYFFHEFRAAEGVKHDPKLQGDRKTLERRLWELALLTIAAMKKC